MSKQVVTRFAPSPTGFLHIGGARTALFNYLFAKHHQGRFLLRIEDTDRTRSTNEAVDAILEGLTWLNLSSSEPPVFQHRNADRHIEVALALLKKGSAYKCTCTAEDIEAMRERARKAGKNPQYDGRCRHKDHTPKAGTYVVRFKSPVEGSTVVKDLVQGNVTYSNDQFDDLVLLRADGTPTYNLAVVVDDHDMGVTHVIRGDDHLNNAARQTHIYDALGWKLPTYAHIPLIHGEDGAKLSKRHGALGVMEYEKLGYLADALCNYLARLGWAHGNQEIFTRKELIDYFSLEKVGKAPSRLDFKKLDHVNAHYIKDCDSKELLSLCQAYAKQYENELYANADTKGWTRFEGLLPTLQERGTSLRDLLDKGRFLLSANPISMDEAAKAKIDDDAKGHLSLFIEQLHKHEDWSTEALNNITKAYIADHKLKFPQLAMPLRAALTGTLKAPGVAQIMYALGKELSLDRIEAQL